MIDFILDHLSIKGLYRLGRYLMIIAFLLAAFHFPYLSNKFMSYSNRVIHVCAEKIAFLAGEFKKSADRALNSAE